MSVRTYDPRHAEIFGPGVCAGPATPGAPMAARLVCPTSGPAKVYCRGCNLVFCHTCAHPAAHNCHGVDDVNARRGPDGDAWLAAAGYTLQGGAWVWPHNNKKVRRGDRRTGTHWVTGTVKAKQERRKERRKQ